MIDTAYRRKWIYGALVIQSIVIIILLFNSCNRNKERYTNSNAKEILDGLVKPEQVYTDDSGRTHLVIKPDPDGTIVRKESDLEAQIYRRVDYIFDSAARSVGVKPKQVEQLQSITSTILYSNEPYLKRRIDTLEKQLMITQTFNNQYLSLTSKSGNLSDSTDKGTFDYRYNAAINSTQYWKRNKLLGLPVGKRVSYTDLTSTDPNATINGVTRYTVRQEQPSFGVRLQASAAYNLPLQRFSAGPGVRIDLGRISLYGGVYRNFQNNTWNPTLSGYYDIIRL